MPEAPEIRPVTKHLPLLSEQRNRGPAATVGEQIKVMMETDAWKTFEESIEDLLRWEQRALMMELPGKRPEEGYERAIGQWSGLRMAIAVAEGIVAHGEKASEQMRAAEAA